MSTAASELATEALVMRTSLSAESLSAFVAGLAARIQWMAKAIA